MTLPGIVLGVVLSSLYGSAFHLWRGGNFGRLILYILISWVGFWAGHFLAGAMDWTFASVGALHVGLATIGSLLFLVVGHWLSLVQIERPNN
jgi:hypothetical protein